MPDAGPQGRARCPQRAANVPNVSFLPRGGEDAAPCHSFTSASRTVMNEDSTPPIEIVNLTRRFGTKAALNDVSLMVPRGCVFGLVGENGAGKTTLLKHVLG